MNIDTLKKLKVAIDTFDDAAFVSLLSESEVLIQNIKTKSLWSLPFNINENMELSFFPSNGNLLESFEEESEYENSVKQINKNILMALKENDDESYKNSLRDLLKYFNPSKIQKSSFETEDFLYEGTHYDFLDESEKQWVKNFQSKWNSKLEKTRSIFLDFQSIGQLFNENNEMKDEEVVPDPNLILLQYQNNLFMKESIFENLPLLQEWNERISDEIDSSILEGVNPFDEDWKNKILKNLLIYKKEINSDISVNESLKTISEIFNEVFENCDMTPIASDSETKFGSGYDGEGKLHFLKMSGIYSNKDLENLSKDFDYALGSWKDKDQDELRAISSMKDKIEYMYRTNMIDDETVSSIINAFNMKYGRDGRDLYRNPDMTSGSVQIRSLTPEVSLPLAV